MSADWILMPLRAAISAIAAQDDGVLRIEHDATILEAEGGRLVAVDDKGADAVAQEAALLAAGRAGRPRPRRILGAVDAVNDHANLVEAAAARLCRVEARVDHIDDGRRRWKWRG